jgi:TRAP-type uncharacterized transport system substrate-binding protein
VNSTHKLWHRRRGWLALLLGLAALAAALATSLTTAPVPLRQVTLTSGFVDTSRALVARALAAALATQGLEAHLVETSGSEDVLDHVERGAVDFALVSSAYRIERYPHVRAVTPIYVEALHLLVKDEFADAVAHGLDGLRGRTVDLGPRGSTTTGLGSCRCPSRRRFDWACC